MTEENWHRRHAVMLASQLLEATEDALAVLRLATELVTGFLDGPSATKKPATIVRIGGNECAWSAFSSCGSNCTASGADYSAAETNHPPAFICRRVSTSSRRQTFLYPCYCGSSRRIVMPFIRKSPGNVGIV